MSCCWSLWTDCLQIGKFFGVILVSLMLLFLCPLGFLVGGLVWFAFDEPIVAIATYVIISHYGITSVMQRLAYAQ